MRVLVAYATRTGSTRGIAEAIAGTLRTLGDDADAVDVRQDPAPEGYDAVFVGSAIRGRDWLKEGKEYVERHEEALDAMPLACFVVCLAVVNPKEGREVERYTHELEHFASAIHPVVCAPFAGALDLEPLSTGQRLFVSAFGVAPGDYRDFDAVERWTRETRELLAKSRVPALV